jgi:hypothetical protein
VFPVFVSRGGKSFSQTAIHVWDRLPAADIQQRGAVGGSQALAVYDQCCAVASEEGLPLWQDLEREHRQRWEAERARAQYHFTARRKMLNQIGLAEVKGYRTRHLEAEETARMAQLDQQKHLLPELEALTMFSIEQT